MDIQVKIAPRRRNHERSWHKRGVNLESSVAISAVRGMDDLPACEATLVIITQNTREYVHNKEVLKVYAQTIPIPAASGARRKFSSTSCR